MGQHTEDMGFSLLPLVPNTAVGGLDQNPFPPGLPVPQPWPRSPACWGQWGGGGAEMLPQRVVILEVQVPFLYMLPDSKLSGGKSSTLYALLLRAVA